MKRIPQPNRYNPAIPDAPGQRAMKKSGSGHWVLYREWASMRDRIEQLEHERELLQQGSNHADLPPPLSDT